MKIAAFNVENLFDRANVFNEDESISSEIIDKVSELNQLIKQIVYTPQIKRRMEELLTDLGLKNKTKVNSELLEKFGVDSKSGKRNSKFSKS